MKFTKENTRGLVIIILAIILAGSILAGLILVRGAVVDKPFVPPELLEAKGKGVDIAESIVNLSKESLNNLKAISAADETHNYSGGLDLVLKEIARNKEARDKALELSQELGMMAAKLIDVRPESAARVGLQAIGGEFQIAQHLIDYNNYIYQLLEVLQSRFTNKAESGEVTSVKVKDLVDKMNKEAAAINDLNVKYQSLMREFDILTNQ